MTVIRPYGDTTGDGMVQTSFTLPVPPGPRAEGAALQLAGKMGIHPAMVVHSHGIGEGFHTGLVIPHYDAAPNFDTVIETGMTVTIEPMLTLGTHEWEMWADGWTVVTKDRRRTAQFEHTILVTETGAEILTLP